MQNKKSYFLTLNVVNVDIGPGHQPLPGVHPPEHRVHHVHHPPAQVQTILDKSEKSDVDTLQVLIKLKKLQYVTQLS